MFRRATSPSTYRHNKLETVRLVLIPLMVIRHWFSSRCAIHSKRVSPRWRDRVPASRFRFPSRHVCRQTPGVHHRPLAQTDWSRAPPVRVDLKTPWRLSQKGSFQNSLRPPQGSLFDRGLKNFGVKASANRPDLFHGDCHQRSMAGYDYGGKRIFPPTGLSPVRQASLGSLHYPSIVAVPVGCRQWATNCREHLQQIFVRRVGRLHAALVPESAAPHRAATSLNRRKVSMCSSRLAMRYIG
jgi:hypothetical protein